MSSTKTRKTIDTATDERMTNAELYALVQTQNKTIADIATQLKKLGQDTSDTLGANAKELGYVVTNAQTLADNADSLKKEFYGWIKRFEENLDGTNKLVDVADRRVNLLVGSVSDIEEKLDAVLMNNNPDITTSSDILERVEKIETLIYS